MGMLREGYTCKVRMWADSDELTTIRWFPADPNAAPFSLDGVHPIRHRFDSLYWRRGSKSPCYPFLGDPNRPEEQIDNRDIGEQGTGFNTPDLPRLVDTRGNIHGLTGQQACHPELGFTGGLSNVNPPLVLDEDGVPVCCRRVPLPPKPSAMARAIIVTCGVY